MMAKMEALEREDKVDQMYEYWFVFFGVPIKGDPKELELCVKGEMLLRSKVQSLVDAIFYEGVSDVRVPSRKMSLQNITLRFR